MSKDADVELRMATRAAGRGKEAVKVTEKDLRLHAAGLAAAAKLKGTQPPLPLHTPQSSRTRPLSGVSQPVQDEPSPPHTPQASRTLPLGVGGGGWGVGCEIEGTGEGGGLWLY